MNRKTKLVAVSLLVTSVFSLCSFTSGAVTNQSQSFAAEGQNQSASVESRTSAASFQRYELSVSKVYNKNVGAYSKLSASRNGTALKSDVRMMNGVPYVAVRSFIEETTNMTVTYRSAAKTLNVRGSGFEMDVIDGSNVIYANGRTLFSMTPSVVMTNGYMYAPLSNISKALGLSYSYNSLASSVSISGSIKPLTHGNTYYASDAVYWLSRIISAESRGESLLGQIAVGSVVMNRVKAPSYPNTIWGVIFDKKYGVQFSPIIDGSIYQAPAASAVVAAKICLEGFNVNKNALFFLYPRASTSSWIPNNRPYLFSIGKHDFYA